MGIFGGMKERMMHAMERARSPDISAAVRTPAPKTRVYSDAEWSAPDGLDPHQASLARIMLRLRADVADLSPEAAVKRMGLPFGFESVALVPERGPARDGWTDRKMFEALSRDGDYMTMKGQADARMLDAIDREMVKRLAEDPAVAPNFPERTYALRADVTGRVVDFMQGGARLDQRVTMESQMLERQSSSVIADRFRDMPIASLVPLPDRGEARRAWLEDTLRAEHAAASQGMLPATAIVHAAAYHRGPVLQSVEPAPHVIDRSRSVHEEVAVEAARIEKLSEASLRSRFRDVPGVSKAIIPEVSRGDDRRTWVETLLVAQRIREAMPAQREGTMGIEKDPVALVGEVVQSRKDRSASVDVHRQVAVHSFAVSGMMGGR